jgi:RHS repeat-associated protein
LGSTRLVTDEAGNTVARHDYRPFGDEIGAGYGGRTADWAKYDSVQQKFTGQEHDGETEFDFFHARYLSGAQQRFMSADPGNAGADPMNPQSWNAYAYVNNNPMNATDPTGYCDVYFAGITMGPGENPVVDGFSKDMIAVFPYSGTNTFSGLGGVLGGMGNEAGLAGIRDALSQTAPGENVNVFTTSGGSSTFANVYSQLTSSERGRIGNVTYMIPANFKSSLPAGNGKTAFITGGAGIDDFLPSGRPTNYEATTPVTENGTLCGHNAACIISSSPRLLRARRGTPCGSPHVLAQKAAPPPPRGPEMGVPAYAGFGWNIFEYSNVLLGPREDIQSTIKIEY